MVGDELPEPGSTVTPRTKKVAETIIKQQNIVDLVSGMDEDKQSEPDLAVNPRSGTMAETQVKQQHRTPAPEVGCQPDRLPKDASEPYKFRLRILDEKPINRGDDEESIIDAVSSEHTLIHAF